MLAHKSLRVSCQWKNCNRMIGAPVWLLKAALERQLQYVRYRTKKAIAKDNEIFSIMLMHAGRNIILMQWTLRWEQRTRFNWVMEIRKLSWSRHNKTLIANYSILNIWRAANIFVNSLPLLLEPICKLDFSPRTATCRDRTEHSRSSYKPKKEQTTHSEKTEQDALGQDKFARTRYLKKLNRTLPAKHIWKFYMFLMQKKRFG